MNPANESNTSTSAISGFLQAIRSSSILSERQLKKLEANVADGEYPPQPDELASRLVKDGVLTEYQARQVLKGKSQGLVFGRYVILDFLGKGAMGKVYKAWHRMMGRVVALKILDPRYVSSNKSLARFHREMQLVGRLDHPNVVRAFDADHIGEYYFIAMEYTAGKSLQDLLQEHGALPPVDVVYFAAQAADGLAHAHARGVLHRDIKPSNLLLTDTRIVKILDFGLGTLLQKEDLPTDLTAAGITVGTPDYISPEQARMLKLDGRSDLYSLGCTMYHLISGELPFKGESSMDCLVGRITGQAAPISGLKPGLPPRLVQSIEKLMATNPDDRYQTADEAAAALRTLLRPKKATTGQPAPTVAAAPVATAKSTAIPATSSTAAPAASAVSAPASVLQPASKGATNLKAPSPRGGAGVRTAKSSWNSLCSAWTSLGTRHRRLLGAVAGGAALIIIVAGLYFRPTPDEQPAPQHQTLRVEPVQNEPPVPKPENLQTNITPVPPAATAGFHKSSLVIENPKDGETVSMNVSLTGRIDSEGWPAIFVQAALPGQPWWCQAPIARVDGGRFSTQVIFGDEFTPSGMKFRVVGVVARTREEALKFQTGYKAQALPEGLPQSAEVVVTHR